MFPVDALLLAACAVLLQLVSSQDNCKSKLIHLTGVGSSFPTEFYSSAGAQYAVNRLKHGRNVAFKYQNVNSAYGLDVISRNRDHSTPVVFAAGESLLSQNTMEAYPELQAYPVAAGALVVICNLPGINNITIFVKTLAKIYDGEVTFWDDDEIAAFNPGVNLPHHNILVVARADKAGDTQIFTAALSSFSENWKRNRGMFMSPEFEGDTCCNTTKWASGVVKFFGSRVNGMIGIVTSIPYTIGYAAHANVIGYESIVAQLANSVGHVVPPSSQSIHAAIDYHLINRSQSSLTFDISNALSPDAYPLASFTYVFVNISTSAEISCCQMQEFVGFMHYLTDTLPVYTFESHNVLSISTAYETIVSKRLEEEVICQGSTVYDGYLKSLIIPKVTPVWVYVLVPSATAAFLVAAIVILCFLYIHVDSKRRESSWIVDQSYVTFSDNWFGYAHGSQGTKSSLSNKSTTMEQAEAAATSFTLQLGRYSENIILLNAVEGLYPPRSWKTKTKQQMLKAVTQLKHPNLLRIIGVTTISHLPYTMLAMAKKGTLHYVLRTTKYEVDDDIKFSLAKGLLDGIAYLHKNKIGHGLISSVSCYLSANWTLKISCWDYCFLCGAENMSCFQNYIKYHDPKTRTGLIRYLYLDPDLMNTHNNVLVSDIYSAGMMMFEIFTLKLPFENEMTQNKVTFEHILRNKFRQQNRNIPQFPDDIFVPIKEMIVSCVTTKHTRPSALDVLSKLRGLSSSDLGMADIMIQKIELYMVNLELTTKELKKVTKKIKELLHEVLPPSVADKLSQGQIVPPEYFELISIYFSDIVGFTDISSRSTPIQVMSFLNNIWTIFDAKIREFDVYKVDTIGDAYMVASGLPKKNGKDHIRELCLLAIALVLECQQMTVPHIAGEKVQIRIGINSGPVTAGVVGTRMPQYCVFGDTVNTASRMESTSLPMKIQLSEKSVKLLNEDFPEFQTKYRGKLEIKGKGTLVTYWLDDSVNGADLLEMYYEESQRRSIGLASSLGQS